MIDHTTNPTKAHSRSISSAHALLGDPVLGMMSDPIFPRGRHRCKELPETAIIFPDRPICTSPPGRHWQFRFDPSKPLVGVQQLPVDG